MVVCVILSEMSQQLLDGVPRNLVHTFILHSYSLSWRKIMSFSHSSQTLRLFMYNDRDVVGHPFDKKQHCAVQSCLRCVVVFIYHDDSKLRLLVQMVSERVTKSR